MVMEVLTEWVDVWLGSHSEGKKREIRMYYLRISKMVLAFFIRSSPFW